MPSRAWRWRHGCPTVERIAGRPGACQPLEQAKGSLLEPPPTDSTRHSQSWRAPQQLVAAATC
eukprot:11217535-Lingulodinium_polyedra.AAC.1